jgi:lipopolysaccharide transport system permease protein
MTSSTPSPAPGAGHMTIIEPSRAWYQIDWSELWSGRELLFFFVWRDIKVRYKQTALGVAWAVLQPLAAVVIFSLFFGRLVKVPSGGIPYPLFAYCGTLMWQFFARSLGEASVSLTANERLLSKVYFPRLYLPVGVVLAALVDFAIALLLAIPMVFYYGRTPGWTLLLLPIIVVMVILTALGVGLMFSAFDVRYRDVRYVLPFLIQIWMFASPVIYPSSLVPAKWQPLFGLNPMAGFIETFRAALVGTNEVPWRILGVSSVTALLLASLGLLVFHGTERRITDIV